MGIRAVSPSGKANTDLFGLFAESGNALVGVDSTAAESPADSTETESAVADTVAAEPVVADSTAAEPVVVDTVAVLSPAEARAELARLGIAYNADTFVDSASVGNLAVVRVFVESGMSANTEDDEGLMALHWAAYGHLDVIRYLLEQGADVNATTGDGFTALRVARFRGHTEIAEYLESVGRSRSRSTAVQQVLAGTRFVYSGVGLFAFWRSRG